MKLLITGAQGYLGALLYSELRFRHDVIGTSHYESNNENEVALNIQDAEAVNRCVIALAPDVIIHTAAIANVAVCEKKPFEAFKTNTEGTLNVVNAANAVGSKVVFISSLAAQNPSTVYGKSKQDAEAHVRTVKAGYEILQLSMTFGLSPNTTNHRPFNKILSTKRTGLPNVYDNIWRFQPTHTEHFIGVINLLLEDSFKGRNLAVTIDEYSTLYQIASDILAPQAVKAATLYENRGELFINPKHLSQHGLPTCTYSSMIDRLRKQLAQY